MNSPTLEEIIRENAKDVERSGYYVEDGRPFSWVSIRNDDEHETIFLQDHEADDFVDEAQHLYEEVGTVTMDEVLRHLAKSYIEALA